MGIPGEMHKWSLRFARNTLTDTTGVSSDVASTGRESLQSKFHGETSFSQAFLRGQFVGSQKNTSLVPKHFGLLDPRPFSQGMRVLKSDIDPLFLLSSTPIFEVSGYILLSLQLCGYGHLFLYCLIVITATRTQTFNENRRSAGRVFT